MATPITEKQRKEKKRLNSRKWRAANRGRHRAYTRQYRKDHPDERYEANRQWAAENPELVRGYHHKSRAKNPESYQESWAKWRKNNPGKKRELTANRRAKLAGLVGTVSDAEWVSLCKSFDYRCACCHQEKPLARDHIVPVSWGGRNQISNIQPLCRECNSAKGARMIDFRFTYFLIDAESIQGNQ